MHHAADTNAPRSPGSELRDYSKLCIVIAEETLRAKSEADRRKAAGAAIIPFAVWKTLGTKLGSAAPSRGALDLGLKSIEPLYTEYWKSRPEASRSAPSNSWATVTDAALVAFESQGQSAAAYPTSRPQPSSSIAQAFPTSVMNATRMMHSEATTADFLLRDRPIIPGVRSVPSLGAATMRIADGWVNARIDALNEQRTEVFQALLRVARISGGATWLAGELHGMLQRLDAEIALLVVGLPSAESGLLQPADSTTATLLPAAHGLTNLRQQSPGRTEIVADADGERRMSALLAAANTAEDRFTGSVAVVAGTPTRRIVIPLSPVEPSPEVARRKTRPATPPFSGAVTRSRALTTSILTTRTSRKPV